MKFELKLSIVRIGGNKSNKQLREIENITNSTNRERRLLSLLLRLLLNDYLRMVHKAAYDSKHGKGLKILRYKQMLQRFPILLAKVKAGNTSQNLLNEIRQIIYSLY